MKRSIAPEISVTQLPLYKKALEICQLSLGLRSLDKQSINRNIYSKSDLISAHHLDALVFSSVDLPRTIAQAAVQKDSILQKSLSSYIRQTTKKVRHHLKMLGRYNSTHDAQFLALRTAIKEFGQLQKHATSSHYQNN